MGVIYTVMPLDQLLADYLRDVGVAVPAWTAPSRNPSPHEIRGVCAELTDLHVEVFAPPEHAWQVMVQGLHDPEHEPWTLLNLDNFNGDEHAPHSIWFEKGWPSVILRIAKALSIRCGPLVIVPDTGCRPLVVFPTDNVDVLLSTWEHASG